MGSNPSRLSPTDFKEIASGTKFTVTEINEWSSKFYADFPRGRIRKYEFLIIYKKMFPKGDANEFCEHIFNTYDSNGDGIIDFREFMTTLNVMSRGTATEKLEWTFRMYDLNGDGFVSEKELVHVLTAIYKARNQSNPAVAAREKARDLIEDIDTDGDGRLSVNEFVTSSIKCQSIRALLQGMSE